MTVIWRLSLPLTFWLVGFSVIYALQGLACSRHWPPDFDARVVLLGTGAVVVALQAALTIVIARPKTGSEHLQTTVVIVAATALFATVWTLIPVLMVSICQ